MKRGKGSALPADPSREDDYYRRHQAWNLRQKVRYLGLAHALFKAEQEHKAALDRLVAVRVEVERAKRPGFDWASMYPAIIGAGAGAIGAYYLNKLALSGTYGKRGAL